MQASSKCCCTSVCDEAFRGLGFRVVYGEVLFKSMLSDVFPGVDLPEADCSQLDADLKHV